MKKTLLLVLFFIFFGFGNARASEGTFELRSTTQYDYKCFAASLLMQSGNYKVILSCRNILYPGSEEGKIYTYVLWANPTNASDPIKLGNIGLGKGEYSTKTPFASLFVTTEANSKIKQPAGEVVMRGSIKPITFLEKTEVEDAEEGDGEGETGDGDEKVSPTTEPTKASVRDRLILGLKRAGLASGLALIAILGLVFVLTRPK